MHSMSLSKMYFDKAKILLSVQNLMKSKVLLMKQNLKLDSFSEFEFLQYRILSLKRPGSLHIFFYFGVGIYWRGAFIQKN